MRLLMQIHANKRGGASVNGVSVKAFPRREDSVIHIHVAGSESSNAAIIEVEDVDQMYAIIHELRDAIKAMGWEVEP